MNQSGQGYFGGGCSRFVRRCRCTAAVPPPRHALLHKAGLVHHEDAVVGTEVVDGVGADIVAEGVGVPAVLSQQALHGTGSGVGDLFGQLPAVHALDAG